MSTGDTSREQGLTEERVRKVARLARLDLAAEEIGRMTAELSAIVGYVQKLSELDTTNVPPTAQVQVERLALRPDEPEPSLSHDEALGESSRVSHDGFAVPGFVDE
jgi:aspartyl-tRNA(Asn)/glutamyl-tRNA(Gln) amidotransferase subunit C